MSPDRATPSHGEPVEVPDCEKSARLGRLLERLDARAAGWWRVEGGELVQVAFASAADMPRDVAARFAEATSRVPLDRVDLGIVKAAIEGRPAISRASELPADTGSGYWLGQFGARRSVAVPLLDAEGGRRGVASVALGGEPPSDEEVARVVREAASPRRVPSTE